MSPAQVSTRSRSVLLGVTLAVAAALCALPVAAQAPNPVPLINLPLVPDAVAPGGQQFVLTINGTGFVSNSTVNWNSNPLATTFVSGSRLTAVVPAADVATAGTGWVTVVNPAPGGGTSNLTFFTVIANLGDSVILVPTAAPAVGNYPYSVAVGDFNGDGKLDLAVANYCGNDSTCKSPGTVSILLGDGTGNFTLASSPTVGFYPVAIAVGDFNGDGKQDLAVANYGYQSNSVSILLGDGTGNFTLASTVGVGEDPAAIVAGDFNGDGNLDLAVAINYGDTLSILLGDGTGNFSVSSLWLGAEAFSVVAGDFNGDGKLDLAVGTYNSTIYVLLGDGNGNFTLGSSLAAAAWPESLAVGDFNGDGKLDLAASTYPGGGLSIFLGDGTGNFTLASSGCCGGGALSEADFNGDGNLDLAVGTWYGTILMLGDGTGNFTLASNCSSWPWWTCGLPGAVGGPPAESIGIGDFNGDGKLDFPMPICTGDYCQSPSTVSILLQALPAATFSPPSLSFATQLVATASSPQTVTLTNSGGETLNITSITASAGYSQTNTCGSSLDAGANCTINVTFTPHSVGTVAGTITVVDNAYSSPQTVSLTGVGTVVSLSPGTLTFNAQAVGTTSSAHTVTLLNHGMRTLHIAGFSFGGGDPADYAQTNTCGTSVPSRASCTISVTFTPHAQGKRTATLNVADDGGGSPQWIALHGVGTD